MKVSSSQMDLRNVFCSTWDICLYPRILDSENIIPIRKKAKLDSLMERIRLSRLPRNLDKYFLIVLEL